MSILSTIPWLILLGLGLGFWIKSKIKDSERYTTDGCERYSNSIEFKKYNN